MIGGFPAYQIARSILLDSLSLIITTTGLRKSHSERSLGMVVRGEYGVWLDQQTAANWILKEIFRSQSWGDVISKVASHDGAANTPQSVEEDIVNFRHNSAEEEEFDGKPPGLAQAGN
jgi:hypothetical protein